MRVAGAAGSGRTTTDASAIQRAPTLAAAGGEAGTPRSMGYPLSSVNLSAPETGCTNSTGTAPSMRRAALRRSCMVSSSTRASPR